MIMIKTDLIDEEERKKKKKKCKKKPFPLRSKTVSLSHMPRRLIILALPHQCLVTITLADEEFFAWI